MIFRKNIFIVSTIYFVAAIILFPYLRYYIDNPDSFSYISISEKYANGNFSEAINGYWSPLICWLLAIPVKLKVDAIVAFKILQLLIGWFALLQWLVLAGKILQKNFLRLVVSVFIIPFLLSWSLLYLTADLLLLTVLLLYLNFVCETNYFNKKNSVIVFVFGIIGTTLYFSKSFGFVFFILHFSTITVLLFFKSTSPSGRQLLKNYTGVIVVFLFLSGVWSLLLSKKYHHFTIGETPAFNLSREVAITQTQERTARLLVLSGGLHAPPTKAAVAAWEDPVRAIGYTRLRPLSSTSDFHLYKNLLKRNFLTIYFDDFRRQAGTLFILALVLFLVFSPQRKRLFSFPLAPLLLTIILFYGLYGLVLVHSRYVWVCTLLMVLLTVYFIEALMQQSTSTLAKIFFRIFIAVVLLLAAKRPFKEIFFAQDTESSIKDISSVLICPQRQLDETYAIDKMQAEAADSLKKIIEPQAAIASIKENFSKRDNYARSSLIAYKSGAKYFGQIQKNELISNKMRDALNQFQIKYILLWNNDSLSGNTPINQKRIYANEKIPLQVFELSTTLKP